MSHFTSRIRPVSQQAASFPRSTGEPNQAAKWEAVFGPMPTQPQTNAYSHYPNVNKQLPDAYIGQNVFLSEKVAGLIATTGAFWSGVLLPWLRSDHIGPFTWSRWEFNQVLATRVPHESVARLVTTEQREYQVRPVRRGLAMQMEGDFVNHPDGQLHFARKVQGMIASIQTTIDFDIQHTILTSNDQRKMEQHRIGVNALPIKEELDIEVDTFAAISKSPEHFARVIKDAEVYLMDAGAQPPFTLLVTPEAVMDMSYFTVPAVKPQRAIGGTAGTELDPKGQLGRTDLPTGDFVTPDGTAVFQVRSINFGSKGAPYQMFSRPKLIAEYYHLTWARYRGANLFDGTSVGPADQYWSDARSILVKNETTDQMAKVTMETCLRNGGAGTQGFPDMDIVKRLAANGKYKPEHFDPGVDPLTGEAQASRMHSKQRRHAHMMLTLGLPESKRPVRAVHFVGQMDSNVTSAKNIEQMAQTLVAGVSGISKKDVNTAWELIEMMKALDAAKYNRNFFEALITENSKRNWRDQGDGTHRFQGATNVDALHSAKWNTPEGYVEWRPNDAGFMNLPLWDDSTMGSPAVPPGCANLTGLLALRALKGKSHGYGDLPDKANRALSLLGRLGSRFSSSLTSASMDAVNRAPWHLKANPLVTMFESCVNVPRDPLFLIAAPFAGGTAGDRDYGGVAQRPTLSQGLQSVVQTTDMPGASTAAYNRLVAGLRTRAGARVSRIFVADTGGGAVVGNDIALAGLALSPEISALRRLGARSAKAYIALNRRLDADTRDQLAGLLTAGGTLILSAQQVAFGLDLLVRGKSDEDAVKVVKATAGGDPKALRKAINAAKKAKFVAAEDIVPIFTSTGDEPTAIETILDEGINVADLPARADQLKQYPALGRAVDRILGILAKIHEKRSELALAADREYIKENYVYAFPGLGEAELAAIGEGRNVADPQLTDGDDGVVDGLLRDLGRASDRYHDLAMFLLGSLDPTFGGMGTGALPGVQTRPKTAPSRPADIRFSDAALKASRYYRSSLVMTPGLKDSIGSATGVPLIRPSEPATGHLEPFTGSGPLPARITNRPQYATVGDRFERTYEHMPWNAHHLDILAYQQSAGARNRVGRRQYADIFAGIGIEEEGRGQGSDNIFGDTVESLLSGEPMSIGAHEPYRASWAYDQVDDTGGGSRPFSEYERAVLDAGDTEDPEIMKTGAWLINNMHLGSMKYHIMEANKIKSNPIVRWAAMAILTSRIDHVDFWVEMARANVLVPCNVLLVRPAIEFVMDNFVLMKAGSDTGGTLFNHSSAMLGWDVYTRMVYLNYLFYSKAFVWGPENIYVLENIMPRRYIAGCGMNFITDIRHLSTAQSQHRHDMLSVILPLEESEFDEVIGILGDRNEVFGDANPEFDGPMESLQYSSADYVREWLSGGNGVSISRMLDEHKTKRVEYFETIGTVPPVVFQGYYQSWDGRAFGLVHPGKGHKGEYSDYNGSRRPWNRRGSPYFMQRSDQPFVSNV